MKLLKLRFAAVFALSLLLVSSAWCRSEYRGITILHTNDTHGHLIPFSYPEPMNDEDPVAQLAVIRDVGGIARRVTIEKCIEKEVRGNVLFLDAGDALDGTPFSVSFMGEADFAAMSAADYDAMACGNHEFSASMREFQRNVNTATFPLLSANLIYSQTGDPALPAAKMFEIDGVKIAVFGLTTIVEPNYKAVREGFGFLDPVETAKALVPELRKKADIIIALTHIGVDADEKLAREVPDIDVIVGGHSHTRIDEPIFVPEAEIRGPFDVRGTLIVQDFQWGSELGRLDLMLRRDDSPFTVMGYKRTLIPVTAAFPEDAATAKTVESYMKKMPADIQDVIGEATETFYVAGEGNPLLNLVCDAIREETGVQVAMYNDGGVRSDLVRGPIRNWDLASMLPFRNKIVEMDITGKRLKQSLTEEKTGMRVNPGVSGMKYRVKNKNLVEASVNGAPIDDNATYTLAVTDFMASLLFSDVTPTKVLYEDYRKPISEYIKSKKVVSPVIDDRRVIE